jgi:hypothetical protein
MHLTPTYAPCATPPKKTLGNGLLPIKMIASFTTRAMVKMAFKIGKIYQFPRFYVK